MANTTNTKRTQMCGRASRTDADVMIRPLPPSPGK